MIEDTYIDGLEQNCIISTANTLEIPMSHLYVFIFFKKKKEKKNSGWRVRTIFSRKEHRHEHLDLCPEHCTL